MPRLSKSTATHSNQYMPNGVVINPAVPSSGEMVKVTYDGLLAKSGATDVICRVGFGSKWDNLYDFRMARTSTGFETTVPVSYSDTLNICFKDCANNWDNNSGKNYTFDVVQ